MKAIIENIKARYGDYLTQQEFMEAAGISSRTAYLATKNGNVPYRKEWVGNVRYYRIRAEDVAAYIEERNRRRNMNTSEEKIIAITTILSTEPDVLTIRQCSQITGFHKNSISKWIRKGYLKSFRFRGDYRIAKKELIRFMASPRYERARNHSLQKQAIIMALEWLENQKETITNSKEDKYVVDKRPD